MLAALLLTGVWAGAAQTQAPVVDVPQGAPTLSVPSAELTRTALAPLAPAAALQAPAAASVAASISASASARPAAAAVHRASSARVLRAAAAFAPQARRSAGARADLKPALDAMFDRARAGRRDASAVSEGPRSAWRPRGVLARFGGRVAGVAAGLSAAAAPALAATSPAASAHHGDPAVLVGAVAGLILAGIIGYSRRDKSSGGDYNFTPLFNALRTGGYALGGAIVGAVMATLVHHPGGFHLALGAATGAVLARAGIGAAAGGLLGWLRRDKSQGGEFDFTGLFNAIRILGYGLVGAVLGAVSVALF